MSKTVKVSDIIWREDLYPRIKADSATIQRYAESIDILPPVEINQNNELIDGYHRWTAHKLVKAETIKVEVTRTASDVELLALACQRNAKHGLQLDEKSKRTMAIRLYASGTGKSKKEIEDILSVSARSVSDYLSGIDKQLREERKQKIFDMWLACYTQEEIAEAVLGDKEKHKTIDNELADLVNLESLPKLPKLASLYQDDFEPPIYNVWSFAKKTNEVSHFGNSEQRIVDNLLYLYTSPFDIVVDPFAGGGATINACQKRMRRFWVSDRKPTEARRDVRLLDVAKELPPLHKRWAEVTLTYLDPPYWRQAAGKYSDDAEDLANMPLDEFRRTLAGIVKQIAAKQSHGVIALLMQPTQWLSDDKKFTDHIADLLRDVKLEVENRISCPYSTEQYNPQQVEWAKKNKKLLVITRELIVWNMG